MLPISDPNVETMTTIEMNAAPVPAASPSPIPQAGQAAASGIYVQVGAFQFQANAERLREKLQQNQLAENVALESWYNQGTYRVRLGPYSSRQDAEQAAAKIKQALGTSAIVIYQ